jgi:1-acyl-sn-glycerol-3-phosphate acyltransferase
MPRFADWLSLTRSVVVTAPLVVVVTAVMGSLSLASSLIDSTGRIQHACARWWGRMVLRICGVTLKVSGESHLHESGTYVFCVNHQSHMDIPVVLAALPIPFRFAAKKELFNIPFLGWHLRRSGHIAIDRQNPHAAVKSFRGASERLRGGVSLVFFPEGGTSLDGSIKPFKGGGFVLAGQSQAAVVPVTIRGSRATLLPQTQHVRGGPVEVILGSPIASEGCSPKELSARVRQEIVTTFEYGKTLDRNTHTLSR